MGQTLSEPIVDKTTHTGKNEYLMYGLSAMQGWRLTMEDAHVADLNLDGTGASFFGVFDGHGGSSVAQCTGQHLHKLVRGSQFFDKAEYAKALMDSYFRMDIALMEDSRFQYDPAGCTAVTALVTPDHKSIIVANAGDSRSVISVNGQSKALSYDHKPVNPKESERITKAGGFVEYGRVNGNLALSRAIGDFEFKQNNQLSAEKQAVTCHPDIIEHEITLADEFFVLACDGIWDCMSNQEVVDYIRACLFERMELGDICERIMDDCLAPSSDGSGMGCDNMSIEIIALLHGKSEDEWYDWMASKAAVVKKDALGNDIFTPSSEKTL
ncbi:phosphatase 2C-like domain-containing protein [Pilobolus umbonatus]|nr:phosphatase 2C-like domain-containing protein [Pilobolus umbonatus]